MYETVRNMEATTLAIGTPLFVSGQTGANANVYIADADNPARRPASLIAADTIAASQTGRGLLFGLISNVDTNAYTAGQTVYLAAGGGWTGTRPTGSAVVQALGIVTRVANNGQGYFLNPGPYDLPNLASGYTWVGDTNGVPQQVTVNSFANRNGLITTGSYSTTQAISGSLILGDLVISSSLIGNDINQGIINIMSEASRSGSVQMNISSSAPVSQSNFIFGNPTGPAAANLTGSIVISGSNNIVFNGYRTNTIANQGSYGYIGGGGNLIATIPTLNTASLVRPVVANNNLNGPLLLNFVTSTLPAPSISNNQIVGLTNIQHQSGSANITTNIIAGAGLTSNANTATLSANLVIQGNIFGNAATTLNQASSSIQYFQNVGGGVLVQNNYSSSVSTPINNINVNNNTFGGTNNIITVSGSNSATRRSIQSNTILGNNNRINSEHSGSSFSGGHLVSTTLMGQSLIVSASHTGPTVGGTVIVGRFNATGSLQESSQDTVFVIGNGLSDGNRRNALRVDQNGNINFTGSIRISGSITNFGAGNINNNTVYGDNALPINTTGTNNLAFGNNALQLNLTGSFNTALGSNALSKALNNNNTAIGNSALQNLTIGETNMAIGANTLQQNISGSSNVAIGDSALQNNLADNNIAIGRTTLNNNTTGTLNTAIGNFALLSNVTGSNNIAIGAQAGFAETTDNNLYISPLFYGTLDAGRSGSLIYGKFDSTTANQKLQVNGQLDVRYGASVTGSVKLTEALNIKPLYYGTGSVYNNNLQNIPGTTGDIRLIYDDGPSYSLIYFTVSGSNSWNAV